MKLQLIELPSVGTQMIRTLDNSFAAPKYLKTDAEFGRRLRETREERGFSLGTAAEKLGVNSVQLSHLERGLRYQVSEIDKTEAIWYLRTVK